MKGTASFFPATPPRNQAFPTPPPCAALLLGTPYSPNEPVRSCLGNATGVINKVQTRSDPNPLASPGNIDFQMR